MGNKKFQFLRSFLLFTDVLLVNGCLFFSMFLLSRFQHRKAALLILAIVNISWLLAAFIFQLYKFKTIKSIEITYRQTWRTFLLQLCLVFTANCIFSKLHNSVSFIVIYGSLISALALATRFFHTYLSDHIFRRIIQNKATKNIAIVGNDRKAIELANYFYTNNNVYNLSGFFSDEWQITHQLIKTPVFPLKNCINHAVSNNVKEIYSTIMPNDHPLVSELVEEAEKNFLRIKFVDPHVSAQESNKYFKVESIGNMPVISLRLEPLMRIKNRLKKRIFDIVVSLFVTLFILSWLIPLLAVLIKLNSKGPVFFVQQRSGKSNRTFNCYKFRSMRVNNNSNQMQAVKNDSRITRIGAFLRKTSLDEFPQFINVLRGDMSISGPRPHMLKHTEEYSQIIRKYMIRHFLRPGITGWAQINGFRGETEQTYLMEKRVEHDIWYMEHWSLMLDVRIVFLTIMNVFKGDKAAR